MSQFSKWIEGITHQDTVCEAGHSSLCARLRAVEHYLPLAAEHSEDDLEYVHQLRVFTRRSVAALKSYAKVLPPNEARWFRKMLPKVRGAAGQARDLDVLLQSHDSDHGKGSKRFLNALRKDRHQAQPAIVTLSQKLMQNQKLHRHIANLLSQTAHSQKGAAKEPFAAWAAKRMRKLLKRFFRSVPAQWNDLAALHRFRIQGKELRYAMELLASAFPMEFRNDLYPIIEELQERLGDINDCVVARTRFQQGKRQTKDKKVAAYLRKLQKAENRKLKQFLREFQMWWTPAFQASLRSSFERMLSENRVAMPLANGIENGTTLKLTRY